MEREESDLYGLPLDEFIAERTELEKRLRKEGERERAAAVKKLPKPTVAAWAVNQASRSQPQDRRELLTASADLRDAQERLIAGDASAADLEKAAARQRAAIDSLVDAASGLLTGDGKSLGDATLAKVRETLAAVAADEELAELVEAGTLDRERRPAGMGFGVGLAALGDEDETGRPAESATEPRGSAAAQDAAKARKERERAERRRKKELAAARERVKAAKRAQGEAAKRQKAAERESRKAAETHERADRAAEKARERAKAAQSKVEAAQAELDRLS